MAALLLTIISILFPIRALIAYSQLPKPRVPFDAFKKNQSETSEKIFRSVSIIAFSYGIHHIWKSLVYTAYRGGSADGIIYLIISVAAIGGPIILLPISYIYDYYFKERGTSLFSFSYLMVLLYALSLPAMAYIATFPLTIQSVHFIVPVEQNKLETSEFESGYDFKFGQSRIALRQYEFTREEKAASVCQRFENNFPFRKDEYFGEKTILSNVSKESKHLMDALINQYFSSLSFGINETFGCQYGERVPDQDNFWLCVIIFIYKWIIGIFVVGVIFSPIKKVVNFILKILASCEIVNQ